MRLRNSLKIIPRYCSFCWTLSPTLSRVSFRVQLRIITTTNIPQSKMSSPFFPNVDPMQPVKPSFHPSTHPSQAAPMQHTQNPKIVGTSVLGLKYKDGIVLAADNLGIVLESLASSIRDWDFFFFPSFAWLKLMFSFFWESCEIQGCTADIQCGRKYSYCVQWRCF